MLSPARGYSRPHTAATRSDARGASFKLSDHPTERCPQPDQRVPRLHRLRRRREHRSDRGRLGSGRHVAVITRPSVEEPADSFVHHPQLSIILLASADEAVHRRLLNEGGQVCLLVDRNRAEVPDHPHNLSSLRRCRYAVKRLLSIRSTRPTWRHNWMASSTPPSIVCQVTRFKIPPTLGCCHSAATSLSESGLFCPFAVTRP